MDTAFLLSDLSKLFGVGGFFFATTLGVFELGLAAWCERVERAGVWGELRRSELSSRARDGRPRLGCGGGELEATASMASDSEWRDLDLLGLSSEDEISLHWTMSEEADG